MIANSVLQLCESIRAHGGRAFLVGGWARDFFRGQNNVDYDLEVYGIEPAPLRMLLDAHGTVNAVGEAFTVYKVRMKAEGGEGSAEDGVRKAELKTASPSQPSPLESELSTPTSDFRLPASNFGTPPSALPTPHLVIDVSLPRRESKNGRGHRAFIVAGDPYMPYEEAARRRDFTINAIMYDPLADEFIDPFNGRADIENKIIRAVAADTFVEDSLRVLRAMQFAARFEYTIDPATVELCRSIDLSDLPAERIWAEVEKWLLQANKPSLGFWAAIELGITEKLWPEINALRGCPQEYEWHPEGWSFTELPFQPRITSPTQAVGGDDIGGSALREFLTSSTTNTTMIPISHCASSAQSLIAALSHRFTSAPHTGANCLDAPSPLSPTILPDVEGLVWSFGAPAINTHEVFRVVFEIPLNYVRTVMFHSVNDFEIVRRVIHPVAVYVMNMLASAQGATEYQLHDDSMNSGRSITSRPTSVHIATVIVDARTATINCNVLFDYDLAVVRDTKVFHNQESAIIHRLFQVGLGDVAIHTALVIDEARKLIDDLPYPKKIAVMLGALCHDFGKPATTKIEDGRIRSKGHEDAGVKPAEDWLTRLNLHTIDGYDVRKQVVALVAAHLAPAHFHKSFLQGEKVSDGAFRRLAQRVEPDLLYRVARADCLGRTGNFQPDAMEWFIAKINDLAIRVKAPEPILLGRHVLALGLPPGPRVGAITKAVFELQLDGKVTNLTEAIAAAEKIL